MIDFLAKIFGYVMDLCYAIVPNYVVAIALFTLLTKIILMPVSLWTNRNGLKMVALMPELNRIKVQYYGDREKIGDEQAALYKEKHYRPLLSTIPLIIQIIILLGMIGVIHSVTDTGAAPALGLIPMTDGGWTWLMPLGAGLAAVVLSFAQNYINPLQREQSKAEQLSSNGVSVGISLVLGVFVSTGVALYWIYSNLFSILVQLACNAIMPPKKYVDYEALEASRKELEALDQFGQTQTKELKKREKADYKHFFHVANKRLVFYSEASGFYKYFQNTIEELLAQTNVVINYVTSDPDDQIFALAEKEPRIQPYYIGERRMITLFMKMDADIVVMTMPDLDTYHFKRSYVRKDVEYVYMFHGIFSGLVTLRKGALDHFDTLLTPTPGFEVEMRGWNEKMGLPNQKMIPCGYGVIDNMAAEYDRMEKHENPVKTVLIAPSWQADNILDSCLADLAEPLLAAGFDVTVRPHPQYIRRFPQRLEKLIHDCEGYDKERFRFQLNFSSNETVFSSDILVTDWSNIGCEYALATKKPVLYINTPMKRVNEAWMDEDIARCAPDAKLRAVMGAALELDEVREKAAAAALDMIENRAAYAETLEAVRREKLYHFGESGKYAADYLIGRMVENQKKAKDGQNGK
ncbi:MAG: membrane protein insertase YidC [Oscillospiraceae bacterium]|nr:membrane protein insertase YidC [Oscillospiraceae bacterium]